MATFQKIIESIKDPKQAFERRQALIKEIEALTGNRLLVYVADVNKPDAALKPEDKTGFSDLIEDVDVKNVDILVNSPGGFAEVTEIIVRMLRSKYDRIRFIVPNMAKSAATMMVLSGDQILMDHRSELGPIDPQMEYPSADGKRREAAEDILAGFDEAKEILAKQGPAAIPAYVPLLNKYTLGLLQGCKNAIQLSKQMVEEWLNTYSLLKDKTPENAKRICEFFSTHSTTLSHARPIGIDKCIELGLNIEDLREERNKELMKKIWELWCLYELHFEKSLPVHKVYENSSGCSLQKQALMIQVIRGPPPPMPPSPPPPQSPPQ